MCIYLDGIRAIKASSDIKTALSLAVLPSFGKNDFLRWYLENPSSSKNWRVQQIEKVARAVFLGELVQSLTKLPEDSGKGEEAINVLHESLNTDLYTKEYTRDSSKAPANKTIYHQILELEELDEEMTLAVAVLNSRRVRRTCLDWHFKKPRTSNSWQVGLFDKLASAVQTDELIDFLENQELSETGARISLSKIREAISKAKVPLPLAPSDEQAKRPCCAGS